MMGTLQTAKDISQRSELLCEMKSKANINVSQMDEFASLEQKKEAEKAECALKVSELEQRLKSIEPLLGDKAMIEAQINMNLSKIEIRDKVNAIKVKFETADKERLALIDQLEGKKPIQDAMTELSSKFHEAQGEIKNLRATMDQNDKELKSEMYKNIDREIQFLEFQMVAVERLAVAIDKRHDAIEEGIMLYHNRKMEQINKAIKDLWKLTYKSKDIETIEIKSDLEKVSARSHSFNYRIVFKTPEYSPRYNQ